MAKEQVRIEKPGTFTLDGEVEMSGSQTRSGLVALAILVLTGLFVLKGFLPALVWAVVFAIGLWPLFERAARRWPRHRHEALPMLFVGGVVLVFVVPLLMVAVPLAGDAHAVTQWAEQARQSGIPAPAILQKLPHGAQLTTLWNQKLGNPGQVSQLTSHAMGAGTVRASRELGAQALHRLVLLGFMLLTLFFLLRQAEDVTGQLRVGSRRLFGPAGEDVGRQVINSVHGTVTGLVLVGLGEGLILGLLYWGFGVPHPTLFGLLTALLAMVPFGAAIGFCIAALALLATGKVVGAIVILVAGFLVSFVADHFVRPVLIGGSTRLPFLWVLLGILGGAEGFGLLGLFLGPAIMAALILLWREWVGAQKGPLNPPQAIVVAR
ncbi:AI-2E family transporter [Lichenicoccus sp.]|uniref:AI-2E family transporter n=1 Tax=Lichenicoccus sp. TaxID=2781899 RepID=UPI003D11BBDA